MKNLLYRVGFPRSQKRHSMRWQDLEWCYGLPLTEETIENYAKSHPDCLSDDTPKSLATVACVLDDIRMTFGHYLHTTFVVDVDFDHFRELVILRMHYKRPDDTDLTKQDEERLRKILNIQCEGKWYMSAQSFDSSYVESYRQNKPGPIAEGIKLHPGSLEVPNRNPNLDLHWIYGLPLSADCIRKYFMGHPELINKDDDDDEKPDLRAMYAFVVDDIGLKLGHAIFEEWVVDVDEDNCNLRRCMILGMQYNFPHSSMFTKQHENYFRKLLGISTEGKWYISSPAFDRKKVDLYRQNRPGPIAEGKAHDLENLQLEEAGWMDVPQ